ncbi:hypothetical protein [Candidatus Hodarchaeum mangrovi]
MRRRRPYQRLMIEKINRSELTKVNEDERWQVITSLGENLSRVWILGFITYLIKGENNYTGITVEDGTGVITVKSWDGSLSELNQWDFIEVLGRIQVSEQEDTIEVYIYPEIVKKIKDDNWLIYHSLKIAQQIRRTQKEFNVEKTKIGGIELGDGIVSFEDLKQKLKDIVQELDEGFGVTLKQIKKRLPKVDLAQIEEAIKELRDDGEFFEPRSEVYSYIFD